MSPFKKNLQNFFIIMFTAIPVVIIVAGIMRSKKNDSVVAVTPEQAQPTRDTSVQPIPADMVPTQGTSQPQQAPITVDGKTYQTPYGRVSASITVSSGKITAVTMPQVPNSPPSIQAKPYLIQQALTSGSANIQGVSGATYTSLAFKSSLESAIAQANTQGQTVVPKATTNTTSAPKPSIPSRYRDDD